MYYFCPSHLYIILLDGFGIFICFVENIEQFVRLTALGMRHVIISPDQLSRKCQWMIAL